MSYDLFEKVKQQLKVVDNSIDWLSGELDKSPKWFYNNRDIKGVSLEVIMQLTRILNFDFLKDYNEYLSTHTDEAINLFFEPPVEYKKPIRKVSVNLKVTGVPKAFKDFDQLLDVLKNEGEKHGFEIE